MQKDECQGINKKPIGILGGTFDPIHIGHINLALETYKALELSELKLIPCNHPLLKITPIANPQQRLAMVKTAIAKYPFLTVDEREIQRGGKSYTIDTLRSLRQELNDIPICLIIGEDQFTAFTYWKDWEKIIDLAHLVVVTRPDHDIQPNHQLRHLIANRKIDDYKLLHQVAGGYLYFQAITPFPISATGIRQQLIRGIIPKAEVPTEIIPMIEEYYLK